MNRLLRYTHSPIMRIILLAFCVTLANVNCWGLSYAKCVVKVSSTYLGGGVYVNDASTSNPSYSDTSQKETKVGGLFDINKTHNFYLYAQANNGYMFKGWYSDDACTTYKSSDSPWNITITGNTSVDNATETYYAKFVKIYNSSVTVSSTVGGTAVVNGNSYAVITDSESQSHSYTLTATPNAGYVFSGWYGDENYTNLISSSTTYTYTITANHLQTNTHIVYALFSNKLTPSITGSVKSLKVGETIDAGYTFVNVSKTTPSSTSDGNDFYFFITHNVNSLQRNPEHENEVIAYDAVNNKIVAYNAGTATITFTQKETSEYYAATQSFNVTVSKNANAISLQNYTGNTVSIPFGKRCAVLSNNDATRPAISISQSSGNCASCSVEGDTPYIHTLFQNGQAVFVASQAEDYMYLCAMTTSTVNVEQMVEEVGYVLYELAEKKLGTNETGDGMMLTGPGDKLTFVAWKSANTALEGLHIQYSVDGGDNYSDIDSPSFGLSNDERYFEYTVPEGTTHIRFMTSGSSYTKHYKDVKVTRKTYLTAPDSQTINVPEGGMGQKTFDVDWSIVNGGELRIANDNAADFTVSPIAFGNGDNADGKNTVTVTYTGDKDYSHSEANLIIYNDVYMKKVTITGNTMWKPSSERYRIKTADNYVTAGVAEPMHSGSHLAQAFVFTETAPNTFSVTYGSDQPLYETVTTEKTDGVWRVKDGDNVLGDITDDAQKYDCTLNVGEAGWATFIAPYPVTVPDGVTAYTLTGMRVCDKMKLHAVAGNQLVANTPYLLKGAGTASYSDYGTASADSYGGDGNLTGTYLPHTTVAGEYVLQQHTSGTGFFLVEDVTPTVQPSRCYIAAQPQHAVRAYIIGEDDVLQIAGDEMDDGSASVYTLSGVAVQRRDIRPGLYIINGKKTIIK